MKKIKRLFCVYLTVCICLCTVGCNKVNDNNSSNFSSTVTQTGTISIDSEIESTEENTSTDESKVSKKENTSTDQSKVSKEENTSTDQSVESSVSEEKFTEDNTSVAVDSSISDNTNTGLTWEGYKQNYLPEWASEYPTSEIVDWDYGPFGSGIVFVITKEKELYQLATEKPFSDGSHFKKVYDDYNFYKQFHYINNSILSYNNEILYTFPQDENIISINSQDIVQTTKGFYKILISTEQEFVDSEPKKVITAKFICAQLEEMFIKYYLFLRHCDGWR